MTDQFLAQIGEAERFVEVAEQDWAKALEARTLAYDAEPNWDVRGRALSPEVRKGILAVLTARAHEETCRNTYEKARQRLNGLLREFDQISDLGLGLGRER